MLIPGFYRSTTICRALTGLALLLIILSYQATAQQLDDFDSLAADYAALDSLLLAEMESDSSNLMAILEDIINEDYLKSQLAVRMGYTSNITNAGRNFGFEQFGLNAGVAYYHKSGLYADVSGFYNSDFVPQYNTTITSLGYMGQLGSKWTYYLSYDHYFYNQPSDSDYVVSYPLTNSLNASINFNLKNLITGVDYSFMFGEETAHRIRLNLGYSLATKKKTGIFDRISFNPNLSMLAGNANVTTVIFNREIARENSRELIRQIGWARFMYLYRNNRALLRQLLSETQTKNTFGIMNYSVMLPVSFTIKKFNLFLNYTLNFPVALPGETINTDPNGYFSATLFYTFAL